MAKIIWLDLKGNRHESDEFSGINSFRSYIKMNMFDINVVELLDCDKLVSLCDSMGRGLFDGCETLRRVENVINTSNVENMRYMFKYCSNLKSVPYIDTSNVKDMCGMFFKCISLKGVPLFDVSSVKAFSGIFDYSKGFFFIPCDTYTSRSSIMSLYRSKDNLIRLGYGHWLSCD